MQKFKHTRNLPIFTGLPDALKQFYQKKSQLLKIKSNELKKTVLLLIRWASGGALSAIEKKVLKKQFITTLKVLPLLTIFLLPFGSLILILLKMLPISFFPPAISGMKNPPLEKEC
ncbi:MAG: hypothetical protein D6748_03840 [Calditrichaeota bacterium]|nr:MAG: hypothetical protein D6748_03840 [Calditrichota bacterium]